MVSKIDVAAGASSSLVSILIPCCGMIEYTKMCVPSILKYSRPPIELIFLDIGSLDGTTEYLSGVQAACPHRVEIVRSPADLGVRDACKEAIQLARGEYLVLLNNDTIVTNGWLNQLINLASLSPTFGMVGPMSNYAAPPQLVETVPYRIKAKQLKISRGLALSKDLVDVVAIQEFANDHREKNKGKWLETDRLGGFCLLMKKAVLDRIGLPNLEKWTDLSLFDTDILSVKTRQAGFTLACCRDLFIHHFGTRTFSHGASTLAQDKDRRPISYLATNA